MPSTSHAPEPDATVVVSSSRNLTSEEANRAHLLAFGPAMVLSVLRLLDDDDTFTGTGLIVSIMAFAALLEARLCAAHRFAALLLGAAGAMTVVFGGELAVSMIAREFGTNHLPRLFVMVGLLVPLLPVLITLEALRTPNMPLRRWLRRLWRRGR
jgi:hypothetical protein